MMAVPDCYKIGCRDTGRDLNIDNYHCYGNVCICLGYQTACSVTDSISPLLPNMPFIQ